VKIANIKKIRNNSLRYDIQTSTNNFFANNILVHNSMIRPLIINGVVRLATKMGVTDVSEQAERYMRTRSNYQAEMHWLEKAVKMGVTPLFEFVAPDNQIVLGYRSADLVLLAIRHNLTGNYLGRQNSTPDSITQVVLHDSVDGTLDDYVAKHRNDEGREGFIISFNGEMYKGKNDWYVRIHKTLDRVRFDRNIVALIVNEDLDDVIGQLPQVDADRIRDFEVRFWDAFGRTEDRVKALYEKAVKYPDRKSVATKFIPKLQNKTDASFVFRLLDGDDMREMLLHYVSKHINTNVQWKACAKWMEVADAVVV